MIALFLSFQFGFLFFFLSWLLWLGLPMLCWIKVVRVGIWYCSWSERKCFQIFTIEYDVSSGLVIYVFYYTEIYSLYTHFVEIFFFFYHKWMLNSVKNFLCSWRIPWTEGPGGLPSMELHRVRHDWSDLAAAALRLSYDFYSSIG